MSLDTTQKALFDEVRENVSKGVKALGQRNHSLAEEYYGQIYDKARAFFDEMTKKYEYKISDPDLNSLAATAIMSLFYSEEDFAKYLHSNEYNDEYIFAFRNCKGEDCVLPNLSFKNWTNPILEPVSSAEIVHHTLSKDPFGGWSRHYSLTAKRLASAQRFSRDVHIKTSSCLIADDFYSRLLTDDMTVTLILQGGPHGHINNDKALINAGKKLASNGLAVEIISSAGEHICLL